VSCSGDFLGAWSLSGAPIEALLPDETAAAMRGQLAGPLQERGGARWRLWAPAPRRLRGGWAAAAGFLAGRGLDGLEEDPEALAEGHYVQAWCGEARAELSRGLSGGERLYYARLGPLVLFASSVRPLLVHPQIGRRLRAAVVDDVLLSGLTLFGPQTLHDGVCEVLAGCALTLADGVSAQRWQRPEDLRSPEGDPTTLARALREQLTEAVVAAAGRDRPVTVALSGGIDSSAVAAAAVDAFGAEGVEAITYEFDDPEHSTELRYARLVAERLGINRHHAFKLDPAAYLRAIPEIVWRSESLVHWPKAFMLLAAREVRRRGRDRYLTGFGFGSHTAYLQELGRALERSPRLATAHWREARFGFGRTPDHIARLHPALEPPHPRLYYLLVRALEREGLIKDVRAFFPEPLWPLLERPPGPERAEPEADSPALGRRLQLRAFAHLLSCIDVTRSERASRELGVARVAPGHFRRVIRYAYFPPSPPPRLYSEARGLRPGKLLLRLAFEDSLPREVVYRVKSWGDAVAGDGWLRRGRVRMLEALRGFPDDAERYGPGYARAIRWWEPRSILATSLAMRLWERMFIERSPGSAPPTWEELR
jgi:asparagine synthetase B (glutamine-hydrolysing)